MTNQDLQNSLIDLLETGGTVLVESERLVHQIRRRFRVKKLEEGISGWEAPKIFTLNSWMDNFWMQLWPEEMVASSFLLRWRWLRDCIEDSPAPEPLASDVELIRTLDQSFELCLRYGLDPGGGEDGGRLIEWRRKVWRAFDESLARMGLFHPARLPEKIFPHLGKGDRIEGSSKMAFVGFEFAGRREQQLLGELQKKTGAQFLALPAGETHPERLVFTDPEQEIIGIVENLLSPQGHDAAHHETAVVLCDTQFYGQALSGRLREILGEPVRGNLGAYNLFPDLSLTAQGLYNAAVQPLRFALHGETRNDLFTLLRSPYYGMFSKWNRALSLWDVAWRKNGVERGLTTLLGSVGETGEEIFPPGRAGIQAGVMPFLDSSRQTVSSWTNILRSAWKGFEFPVIANEMDRIAWNNLERIVGEFDTELGKDRVSAREFFELLGAAAGRAKIQKSGFEDAGLQVLGALDARGLCFGKIFVPGLIAGALPQPVRALPLLGPSERAKVLGGSAESQFAFSRYLYSNFLAAAPRIVFSRPAMGTDGELLIPSPFWPEEGELRIDPVIPWKHTLPAMQRARWVRRSIGEIPTSCPAGQELETSAIMRDESETLFFRKSDPSSFCVGPIAVPESLAVSDLRFALLCPALYFFQNVLGLEKLEEYKPGIPPAERGKTIHAILASFVIGASKKLEDSAPPFETLAELLKKTAADIIGPRLSLAVWQVEFDRLTGSPDKPGLLLKWLADAWQRLQLGWSWSVVERQFDHLAVEGCRIYLKGRVDRIDSHPVEGMICWDYKTGRLPGRTRIIDENTEPQLPAYLLALSRGILSAGQKPVDCCGAGYIELRAPSEVKHRIVFDPSREHRSYLGDWTAKVAATLNSIHAGDMSPLWLQKEGVCQEACPYGSVCWLPGFRAPALRAADAME
ncbi:MAG: PD-(D/E)XK nuclease family protein [Syntrophobacteraceae bacterium]|nr:PD-(D/E)XK nuclease family protein [Syntrophobacteraceae bacterium]